MVRDEIRRSVIAGSWYPGNPRVLRADIEDYFAKVPEHKLAGRIIALLAPHAGYMYSGQVAAYAYQMVRKAAIDSVIVIAPSHRVFFHGISLFNRGGYETPLGVMSVDQELAEAIASHSPIMAFTPSAHAKEHAVEIQLPFLQVALGKVSFVPVVMGDQDRRTCETLAEAIAAAAANKKVLIVASSDLSHYHSYDKAVKKDGFVLKHMEKLDAEGLLKDVSNDICEACGAGPIATAMMAAKLLGADRAKILKYANSGDVTGDRNGVVGYASAVFYQQK
ncbi:MAG: AmmeMemoRadiSam system protein B [Smithellaceae bacterium]|nr:AmmeMemoRadiSam system protein B [Smithellaceae bacterium]